LKGKTKILITLNFETAEVYIYSPEKKMTCIPHLSRDQLDKNQALHLQPTAKQNLPSLIELLQNVMKLN